MTTTSTDMEDAGFMTNAAASHQGVTDMIWLHFGGAVMFSIFINSLCIKREVEGRLDVHLSYNFLFHGETSKFDTSPWKHEVFCVCYVLV